jgi:hypothetical protein
MLTTVVKEIGYEDVNWIQVALNWVWCWVLEKKKATFWFRSVERNV